MKQLLIPMVFFYTMLTISFNSEAAAKVIHCDNCSQFQIESKIKTQPIGNIYYVIDFQSQKLYGYEWFIFESAGMGEESFYPKLSNAYIPSNVRDAITEFFSHRQQFFDTLNSNPDGLSELANLINTSNYASSNKLEHTSRYFENNSTEASTCEKGKSTPHDFMTTSSLRKEMFDRTLSSFPELQSALNTWNSFAQSSSVAVGPASVSPGWLAVPQKINFGSGGHLKVVVNSSGDTYDVVADSAFDCSGNQIPDKKSEFLGNFVFDNRSSSDIFKTYGEIYGIEFTLRQSCLQSYRTTCTLTSAGKYTCTIVQPSC